jgi:DNA repair protein SbcD/Mre11
MTFRLLHLADLHLDHPFHGSDFVPGLGPLRREGLRQCLQRALALARIRQVDAISIGGDLYDAQFVSPDTAQFLRDQFQQIAPLPIVIAPGDDDPYTPDSVYACVDWSPNVYVFREPQLASINLNDDVQLWGVAYDSDGFDRPLLNKFRVAAAETAVLLMHGTEDSLRPAIRHTGIPFAVADVYRADFQLALSGHAHAAQMIPVVNPLVCYPGSPEPLGFGEEGEHRVVIAEWDARRWELEAVDLSRWQCHTVVLDIAEFGTQIEMVARLRQQLRAAHADDKQLVARVILRGTARADLVFDRDEMIDQLGGEFPALRIDSDVRVGYDVDGLKDELTVRGSFVRRMLAKQAEWQQADGTAAQPLFDKTLRYGLNALEGRKVTP